MEVTDLPFVKFTPRRGSAYPHQSYWHVNPTGRFCADWKTGEDYAVEAYEFMHRRPDGQFLVLVIESMNEMDRDLGPLEKGFLSVFVTILMTTRTDLRVWMAKKHQREAEEDAWALARDKERRSARAKAAWQARRARSEPAPFMQAAE